MVKAIRSGTPPEDLEKWAAISIQIAIRDAAKAEHGHANRTCNWSEILPITAIGPTPSIEAIEDLPDHLARTVFAWLEHGGSIERAAKALGIQGDCAMMGDLRGS